MGEFNLKMIKIFFLLVMAMVVLSMTSGMNILRGSHFVDWKKIRMEWSYLKYKRMLADKKNGSDAQNTPAASLEAKSIPILLYHGIIADRDWEKDETNIALKDFQNQMFALKKAGYKSITMADFFDYLKKGWALPEKSFLITFDDGRKDSFYEGDPVLRAVGYNAVMFAITGRSLGENSAGDNFYLGSKELEEMLATKRWEVQSHGDFDHDIMQIDSAVGKGHFLSNRLWIAKEGRVETAEEAKKRILSDLKSAKKKIETQLGQRVFAFAYPFNDYGQESVNFPEARQFIGDNVGKIYPLTFMQVEAGDDAANYPDPKALYLKRIDVNSGMGAEELLAILGRNEEKKLPYAGSFLESSGWKNHWGNMKNSDGLILGETEPAGGNLTTLVGSRSWENYFFKSEVQILSGNSVSQIIRFTDEENYAACNFTSSGISISQRIGGQEQLLAEKEGYYATIQANESELASQVSGNVLQCYLNGNLEIEASISQNLGTGGVGYYIWDNLPQISSVKIKKIDVIPL